MITPTTREEIEVSLFAKLTTALTGVATTIGRKHIMPAQLQPEQQPAVFLQCVSESKAPGPRGLPGKITLTFLIFVYCWDAGADEIPGTETTLVATQINALKDAIDAALRPDPGKQTQTLGNTVSHCWIEGDTNQDPAIFSRQGFAMIPVKVLAPLIG